MNKIKIINGRIITPNGIIENGTLIIDGVKITDVAQSDINTDDYETVDAKGHYVSPGFIDLHTHGGGGHDFMDNTVDAYLAIANIHAKYGATSIMPTTLSSSFDALTTTFDVYKKAQSLNKQGAGFVGLHLEGPYFSMEYRGAQNPKYIKTPIPEEYDKILDSTDIIKRWSAAPELDGAMEFAEAISKRGILPSIAHTGATYEQVSRAYQAGFTHATHFYNCMSATPKIDGRRYAGVVESVYLIDQMTAEIIADGVHLPPALLKLVYKIKGPDQITLVSDAMRGAGMPEGKSILGSVTEGLPVIVEDGSAKLLDRRTLAGSVATADSLVRNMISLAEVPLENAVKMMTAAPADILGLKHKGRLEKDCDADIIFFDDNISVSMTMAGGRIIHTDAQL